MFSPTEMGTSRHPSAVPQPSAFSEVHPLPWSGEPPQLDPDLITTHWDDIL